MRVLRDGTVAGLTGPGGFAMPATQADAWVWVAGGNRTAVFDGTENPTLLEAPGVAVVPDGPGAGSSVVLGQAWRHDTRAGETLGVRGQEGAMGRTTDDSTELGADEMPPSAHVARTTIEVDGEERRTSRRNVACGPADAADRWVLHRAGRRGPRPVRARGRLIPGLP